MPDDKVYIWIEKAVTEYGRSRPWLDEQIRHGRLQYAKFEGDRRTYLLRAELDQRLGKPKEQGYRDQAG